MKNVLKKAATFGLALLMIISLMPAAGLKMVKADDPVPVPKVTGINLDGDILSWDPYDGAVKYQVGWTLGSESGTILPETRNNSLNVKDGLDYMNRPSSDDYWFYVYAVTDAGVLYDSLSDYAGPYSYVASKEKLATPVPSVDGYMASWSAVENTHHYFVYIQYLDGGEWKDYLNAGLHFYYVNQVPGSYTSHYIGGFLESGVTYRVGVRACAVEGGDYLNSDVGWTDAFEGPAVPASLPVTNVSVNADGVVTWDPVVLPGQTPNYVVFARNTVSGGGYYPDAGTACTLNLSAYLSERNAPEGTYEIEVYAWIIAQNLRVDFSTSETITYSYSSPVVMLDTPTAAWDGMTMTWTSVANADGYRVFVRRRPIGSSDWWDYAQKEVAAPATSTTIEGMTYGLTNVDSFEEGAYYKFSVQALSYYGTTYADSGYGDSGEVLVPYKTTLSLSPTSVSLLEGETQQLTATVTGDPSIDTSVSYESSNPLVATVSDSGLVTAMSKGTARITVTSNEDNTVQKSCTVKVLKVIDHMDIGNVWTKLSPIQGIAYTTAFDPDGVLDDMMSFKDQYWKDTAAPYMEIHIGTDTLPQVGHTYRFTVVVEPKTGYVFTADKFTEFIYGGSVVAPGDYTKTLNADGSVTLDWDLTAISEPEDLNDPALETKVTGVSNTTYNFYYHSPMPTVTVKALGGTMTLVQDTDYTLKWEDNINAGTAYVIITGKGNFTGNYKKSFTINKASIKNAAINGIVDKRYTGKAVTQSPIVSYEDGYILKSGTDYTLSYTNNTKAGTATVKITGKGNFKDTVTRTFKITNAAGWERLTGASGTGALGTQAKITGKFAKSDYAILATNADFKDALAGVALAGACNAPVFTNPKGSLSDLVKNELVRLGVKYVIVVGTNKDISDTVLEQIRKLPKVKDAWRVNDTESTASGKSCYAGAMAMDATGELYEGSYSKTVIIATQKSFKDALSISPYAYATRSPIIYVEKDLTLSAMSLSLIDSFNFTQAIIVGGPVAIPDAVKTQLTDNTKVTKFTRLGGAGCYNTSRIIAEWEMGKLANGTGASTGSLYKYVQVQFQPTVKLGINNVGISRGDGWKDAIAGSALCGMNKAVLLLADGTNSNNTAVVKAYKKNVAKGYVFGGTQAVPAKVYNQFVAAAK